MHFSANSSMNLLRQRVVPPVPFAKACYLSYALRAAPSGSFAFCSGIFLAQLGAYACVPRRQDALVASVTSRSDR